jgi:Inner membrane protein CreD
MKLMSSALGKAVIVAAVALLVLIPVQMLRNLVVERAQMREQTVASVSRGWGGRQSLGGPLVAIPTDVLENGRVSTRDYYVLPESLTLESELRVQDDRRKLGVYEVPVYIAKVQLKATFDIARQLTAISPERLHLDRARLLVPVADVRGVRGVKLQQESLVGGALSRSRDFPSRRWARRCVLMPVWKKARALSTSRSKWPARSRSRSCRSRVPPASSCGATGPIPGSRAASCRPSARLKRENSTLDGKCWI